jgi:hypothetical protein
VHRSQKRKKTYGLTVFFALLGYVLVKAVSKMLVKLTPSLLTGNRKEFGLGIPDARFPANKKLNPFGFNAFFFMPGSSNDRLPIYKVKSTITVPKS